MSSSLDALEATKLINDCHLSTTMDMKAEHFPDSSYNETVLWVDEELGNIMGDGGEIMTPTIEEFMKNLEAS